MTSAQDEIEGRMMGWAGVEPRRMFGCDAYLVGGRLFAFFQDDGVVVKVPSPRREELLEDARVAPFTPRSGARFGDWIHIRLSAPADAAFAFGAVEESYGQVQAAPPKKRRQRAM
jgi:predicted DNA-binding protein (MmcQ/YjbR family)